MYPKERTQDIKPLNWSKMILTENILLVLWLIFDHWCISAWLMQIHHE